MCNCRGRCELALTTLIAVSMLATTLAVAAETDRSPSDLTLTPDGQWVVTANTTSGTASLVDLKNGRKKGTQLFFTPLKGAAVRNHL